MQDSVASPYPLDRQLPDGLIVGGDMWFTRYRRFPVFSRRWLIGRIPLFGLSFLALSLFSGWGYVLLSGSVRTGVETTLYSFLSMMVVYFVAPALATLVRSMRMSIGRERVFIAIAVVVGLVVAYLVNDWANDYGNAVLKSSVGKDSVLFRIKATGMHKTISKAIGVGWFLLMFFLIGGGLALRSYFMERLRWQEAIRRKAISELQAQKHESELRLRVLQAQVEPHFLFNTLASVRALLRQDADRAEATLDALVDYLRATIPKLRGDEHQAKSSLGQQLDICENYLKLMRLRTAGRLQYVIDADAALRAMDFPPMLLITLVENAIKHGIEPKPGPGRVTISAACDGDMLRVMVEDDGLGLQPGVGGGLGLANVRAQLDTLFGGRAGFELRSKPAHGVCAELRIPVGGTAA